MSTVYVVDLSAFDVIESSQNSDVGPMTMLATLYADGRLYFSQEVKSIILSTAVGSELARWVKTVGRHMKECNSVHYTDQSDLAEDVPDLVVIDEEYSETASHAFMTVALAYRLQREGLEVCVISEEVFTLEDRCTVPKACADLGIQTIGVTEAVETLAAP